MRRTGLLRKNASVHLLGLFLFCGCGAATWWQVGRALGGNGLSWAYVFEWPCFACCSLWLWRRLLREGEPPKVHSVTYERWLGTPPPTPEEEQLEAERLWAYNRYLGELAVADQLRQLEAEQRRRGRLGAGRHRVGDGQPPLEAGGDPPLDAVPLPDLEAADPDHGRRLGVVSEQ